MRSVCLHMLFPLFKHLNLIFKLMINLLFWLNEISKEKALLSLHAMTETRVSLQNSQIISCTVLLKWLFGWNAFLYDWGHLIG